VQPHRFVEFTNEYRWRWRPLDLDQFLADLRSRETPIELSTLRSYSNVISMFCSCICDGRYGWVAFCEKQFGDVPSQICFEWNRPRHTTDDAVPTKRRAFTKVELQHFFDVVDDFVDEQHRADSKRWLTALRDSIAFKIGYAYRLRRRELVMLDLTDFGPNPHVRRFGDYGAMTVRWARARPDRVPLRRTVLTVPEFPWAVELLRYWCTEGRQLLRTADRSPRVVAQRARQQVDDQCPGTLVHLTACSGGSAARVEAALSAALLHHAPTMRSSCRAECQDRRTVGPHPMRLGVRQQGRRDVPSVCEVPGLPCRRAVSCYYLMSDQGNTGARPGLSRNCNWIDVS
jgi:hypothetical protein